MQLKTQGNQMNKVAVYNLEGKATSEQEVSSIIIDKQNDALFSQAVLAQQANRRHPIASTKDRGHVSGGGKKPFKQKGTGNARAGSTRSPLWIGGGVTFGPHGNRNYSKRISSALKQRAIKMVLTAKINDKKLIVLEDFKLDKISTKQVQSIFEKLPLNDGKILVILPQIDVNLELSLSNIPYAKVIKAENLNVLDLSKYNYLLTTVEGLEKMISILTGKSTDISTALDVKESK